VFATTVNEQLELLLFSTDVGKRQAHYPGMPQFIHKRSALYKAKRKIKGSERSSACPDDQAPVRLTLPMDWPTPAQLITLFALPDLGLAQPLLNSRF